jgi:prophage regulatory protein
VDAATGLEGRKEKTMKLIDLLSTGKQIKTIPKSEIPGLIGEFESLKAQLWMRLMEQEDLRPVAQAQNSCRTPKPIQCDPIPKPEGRILRLKEVVRMVGLSRSTVWNLDREGKFPKHRKLGPRSVGWLDTEVHEWIGTRKCEKTR